MPDAPTDSYWDILAVATKRPWFLQNTTELSSGPDGMLAYVSSAGDRGRTIEEAHANSLLIMFAVNSYEFTQMLLRDLRRALVMRRELTDEIVERLVDRIDKVIRLPKESK